MASTSSHRPCRLIVDPPAAGDWNMSVDEALLQHAGATGQPTLRVYRWSEPTLSLGYFQPSADRRSHSASHDCSLVRRRSGGGAILHDHEITYALAIPIVGRWGRDAQALYATIHHAVIGWLERYGIEAHLFDGATRDEEFLCFHRRSTGDLVLGEDKIMGSAQRRSKSALLQHGSLLLGRSKYAPSLPGLCDISQIDMPIDKMQRELADAILTALQLPSEFAQLSDSERESIEKISLHRFSATSWTHRR